MALQSRIKNHGYCYSQANEQGKGAMHRIFFGLLLIGFAIPANAADSDQSLSPSNPGLSTTRFDDPDTGSLPLDRSTDLDGIVRTSGNPPPRSAFVGTSQLSRIDEPGNKPDLTRSARFQDSFRNGFASHPPRLEFARERLKVTLRADSASMEGGNLKIALRSGSASVSWKKSL